jgi:ATP-dependent Zn protease
VPRSNRLSRRRYQDECTAYHEAGHAAAAFALRRAVRWVSIVPDEARGTLGFCASRLMPGFRPDLDRSPRNRAAVEREVIINFAGGIAEERFRGRKNRAGAAGDVATAVDLASTVCGSIEETSAYLAWLHIRAKNLVNSPVHWPGIEALTASW